LTLQYRQPHNNHGFQDSSANQFLITRNGNATQGTFSPFSQTGWGNYFDGNGDYLSVASNAAFAFGTGDFTIEFWFYPTTGTARNISFPVTGAPIFYMNGSRQLQFETYGAPPSVTTTNTLNLNAWNHCAVSRASGTVRVFVNGVAGGTSTAFSATNFIQSSVNIGTDAGTNFATGYMSDVRIVKGRAVYTADFTPPTVPLTRTTGGTNPPQGTECSLLTCQSNRFIDNSTNNFTVTPNGGATVVAFSPFAPTAVWSASANGGSGYFDGSGDYLSLANPNTTIGSISGNFTIELWINWIAAPPGSGGGNERQIIGQHAWPEGSSGNWWALLGVNVGLYAYLAGGGSYDLISSSPFTWLLGTWYHVALVRSGSTVTIYVNGTSVGSGTSTKTLCADNVRPLTIGADDNGSHTACNAYISNFRFVKGTAVYTGAFTPPIKPLATSGADSAGSYSSTTNVNTSFSASECSLLLNFTNAGIYDATSKNVLETVGDAKISTAQSKWGGSSMSFDGTGDYLINASINSLFYQFDSGDFTVEMWIYPTTVSVVQYIIDFRDPASSTSAGIQWFLSSSAKCGIYVGTTAIITASTTSISANTWTHVALVKNGTGSGNYKIYINGTADATTGTNTTALTQGFLSVGTSGGQRNTASTDKFNGYLQDLRVTKGYARYTANFTPPTGPHRLK